MKRKLFAGLLLVAGLSGLPGCGDSSEAEFEPTAAMTAEEQQATEDYMKEYEQQQKEQYGN